MKLSLRAGWVLPGLALIIACAGLLPLRAADPMPWPDGEKLVYTIQWGLITAAEGTFLATEKEDRWEFHMNLLSKGTVDTFYPINSWFWSFQQKEPWRSIEYGEDRSEGSKRIRERTQADYTAKIAVREKWTKGGTDRIALTQDQLDDVGSMLYSLRRGSWKKGDKRPITVYESYLIKTGEAVCVAIEKRTFVPWPEQELIQIACEPTGETKAKQKGKLIVWMTNDARHLPLFANLVFKYGTFDITLKEAQPKAE